MKNWWQRGRRLNTVIGRVMKFGVQRALDQCILWSFRLFALSGLIFAQMKKTRFSRFESIWTYLLQSSLFFMKSWALHWTPAMCLRVRTSRYDIFLSRECINYHSGALFESFEVAILQQNWFGIELGLSNRVNMAVALTYMYRLMFKNVSGMVFSKFATTFYYDLKLSGSVLCNETQKKG